MPRALRTTTGSPLALLLVAAQSAAPASEPVPGPAKSGPDLEFRLLTRAEPLAECAGAIVFAQIVNEGGTNVQVDRHGVDYGISTGEADSGRGTASGGTGRIGPRGEEMGPSLDQVVGLPPGGSLIVPIHLPTYLVDPTRVAGGTIRASAHLWPKTNLLFNGPAPWEEIDLKTETDLLIDCGSVASPSPEDEIPPGQGLRLDILQTTEPFVNCSSVLAFAQVSNTGNQNVFLDREMIDQEVAIREGSEKQVAREEGRSGPRPHPPSLGPYLRHIVGLAPGGSLLIPIILSELGLDRARRDPEVLPVEMRLTMRVANRLAPERVKWTEARLRASAKVSAMCEGVGEQRP